MRSTQYTVQSNVMTFCMEWQWCGSAKNVPSTPWQLHLYCGFSESPHNTNTSAKKMQLKIFNVHLKHQKVLIHTIFCIFRQQMHQNSCAK